MSFRYGTILVGLLLLAGGCNSNGENPQFAKSYNSLSTGATKNQVRAELGQPDQQIPGTVSRLHKSLPGAGDLAQTLPPNTPFEAWIYHRGQDDYYVYFASGSDAPKEDWRVVSRKTIPHQP